MKKCIIAVLVVLLCATSVYAGGKRDAPSQPVSVPSSSSRNLTEAEIELHKAAGGSDVDYSKVTVVEGRMPTVQEVRNAGNAVGSNAISSATDAQIQNLIENSDGMTLPPSTMYFKESATTDVESKALMAHELEHVAQYQSGDVGQMFDSLVQEHQNGNAYTTPGTNEYKANEIQKNAKDILLEE